jgi:hypothetical protein
LQSDLRLLTPSANRVSHWSAPFYVDAQAHVSVSWLQGPFRSYLAEFRQISSQRPTARPTSSENVQALQAWSVFEQSRFPVLSGALRRSLVRSAPIRDDGSFHISGSGYLVVRAQIGSRILFFPAALDETGVDFYVPRFSRAE